MGPRSLVAVLGILPYTDPDLYGVMTVTDGSLRPSAVFAEFVHYLRKINKKV